MANDAEKNDPLRLERRSGMKPPYLGFDRKQGLEVCFLMGDIKFFPDIFPVNIDCSW